MSTSRGHQQSQQNAAFFKPIGDIAEAADALHSDDEQETLNKNDNGEQSQQQEGKAGNEDDDEQLEHPVEVIESLCMECGENVRLYFDAKMDNPLMMHDRCCYIKIHGYL